MLCADLLPGSELGGSAAPRWGENKAKVEVVCGQMHDLPFKMHWEKIRANIHMPRSGYIQSMLAVRLCSSGSGSGSSRFDFFNNSAGMKGTTETVNLLPPLCSLSPRVEEEMKRMKRRRSELLPAADCLRVQREIVYDPAPGLRAAVPPYRSAARRGSWSTARCAPGPGPGPGELLLLRQRLEAQRTNCLLRTKTIQTIKQIKNKRRSDQ